MAAVAACMRCLLRRGIGLCLTAAGCRLRSLVSLELLATGAKLGEDGCSDILPAHRHLHRQSNM